MGVDFNGAVVALHHGFLLRHPPLQPAFAGRSVPAPLLLPFLVPLPLFLKHFSDALSQILQFETFRSIHASSLLLRALPATANFCLFSISGANQSGQFLHPHQGFTTNTRHGPRTADFADVGCPSDGVVLHDAVDVGAEVHEWSGVEVEGVAALYDPDQGVLDEESGLGVLVLAENIIVIKKFSGLRHSTGFLDGHREGSRES